jgi:hypothetical protein
VRAPGPAVAGQRLEQQPVDAAVGQHLGPAARRDGQHHVERRELAVVATAEVAVAAADALVRVALGRAVMRQAQDLGAPAQSQVAARDL